MLSYNINMFYKRVEDKDKPYVITDVSDLDDLFPGKGLLRDGE